MNITEFLEARIAEDEAVGRDVAASFAQVDAARAKRGWSPLPDAWNIEAGSDGDPLVSIGPSRVLAECAAKRAIVAEHNLVPQTYATSKNWDGPDVGCSICAEWDGLICGEGPCDTIRILAAVYDQHPDYDQAWRVT